MYPLSSAALSLRREIAVSVLASVGLGDRCPLLLGGARLPDGNGVGRFNYWPGVRASKFYDWRERYGPVKEHNGWVPRDFWLEP
jgi:hypothetical protein